MSGSDHDSGEGIGSGGAVKESDCLNLFIRTFLNSPDPAVLKTIAKDSVLSLRLDDPAQSTVTAWTEGGEVAGSVTSGRHAEMIECMRQGVDYIAIVLDINGPVCDIEVRPESK